MADIHAVKCPITDIPDNPLLSCCEHCGCTDERTGHDDTCAHGCNDDEMDEPEALDG